MEADKIHLQVCIAVCASMYLIPTVTCSDLVNKIQRDLRIISVKNGDKLREHLYNLN